MNEAEKSTKKSFFKNLKSEFKRCTWPKPIDLAKETTLVVVVSVVLGVVIDWVIRYGLNLLNIG